MKTYATYSQWSDKQNKHPNIQMPSTEEPHSKQKVRHPKVSSFKTQDHVQKNWRKKVLNMGERERQLNSKLIRMLIGTNSPTKNDKLTTQAASEKFSQKSLQNTLRRYLYENSLKSICPLDLSVLIEQLHRVTQSHLGIELPLDNGNPEQILTVIIDSLRKSKNNTVN